MSTTDIIDQLETNEAKVVGHPEANQVSAGGGGNQAEMTKRAKHHKKWNKRLKLLFCCLGPKKNKVSSVDAIADLFINECTYDKKHLQMHLQLIDKFYDAIVAITQDSIADVASIFAELFCVDLDVPPSDIAAGFVLLSKYQAAQRQWIVKNQQSEIEQYLSSVPITKDSMFLDISTADDSHLMNDLIYYMNYSLAIFGWPIQILDDPFMMCCIYPYLNILSCSGGKKKLADAKKNDKTCEQDKKSKKKNSNKSNRNEGDANSQSGKTEHGGVKRKMEPSTGKLDPDFGAPIILEDNCCGCNMASAERRLRTHNYEIIYVSYKVNISVVPFLVAADHSKQSVVVAIRGSMGLSDVITDMNGQVDKIPIDDCPDDWLCHRGMLKASTYVKSTLIEERILERAFNCRPDLDSQDYNLIICGHSLGAGVAALLGILLRNEHPSLKAYLYSPPGGMLSLPAVEYTKEFATGIILGNDCVPRLGVAQAERLRYYVLLSLKSSQKSTSKILAKALFPTCCCGGNKVDYDPNQSLNLLHGTEGRSFDFDGFKIPFQEHPQVLYVPGRLIHIVKNHTFKSKARRLFNEPIYQAVWTDNVMYDRIMISEGMIFDHVPTNLMNAMKMLFSKTLPVRRDSKTSVKSNQEEIRIVANGNLDCNTQQQQLKRDIEIPLEQVEKYEVVIMDENSNKQYGDTGEKLSSVNHEKPLKTIEHNTPSERAVQVSALTDKNLDENGNDETFVNKNL